MTRRPSFPARLALGSPALTTGRSKLAGVTRAPASAGAPSRALPGAAARPNTALSGVEEATRDMRAVRSRMVQKLLAQGISDPAAIAALGEVERHRFVDSALVNQAYEDTSLPIGLGQTISKPSVVARMVELLLGGQRDATGRLGRVLEIGSGCGYQAAVLSRVATEVYSIERLRGLHDRARNNLRPLRLANVHLLFGDGMVGFAKGAPYAGIIAAAGGQAVPAAWIEQLAVGGRIVAPTLIDGGRQALVVLEKTPREVRRTVLEPVHFVPLKSGVA